MATLFMVKRERAIAQLLRALPHANGYAVRHGLGNINTASIKRERNPDYIGVAARFRQAQGAAPSVGMGVLSVEVRDLRELERALESMDRERPDALLILADPLTTSQGLRIVEFAAE